MREYSGLLSGLLPGLSLLLLASVARAEAPPLQVQPVAENVYAVIGPLGTRAPGNLGNNANFGIVVGEDGVVLIDSGATRRGAELLHRLVRGVTDRPLRYVINTGGQDHRWLGNDYFRSLGARIIASEAAVTDQQTRARDQLIGLDRLLGAERLQGTNPAYADIRFKDSHHLQLGDTPIEIHSAGPAHTPGDAFVWLPRQGVVFSGDIVYVDRMLGVIEVSSSRHWLRAFERLAELQPRVLVPGHGRVTDLARARADTYDYLRDLRRAVQDFMDAGRGIETIGELDQSDYAYLQNYEALKGRNAQKVFQELEWE